MELSTQRVLFLCLVVIMMWMWATIGGLFVYEEDPPQK